MITFWEGRFIFNLEGTNPECIFSSCHTSQKALANLRFWTWMEVIKWLGHKVTIRNTIWLKIRVWESWWYTNSWWAPDFKNYFSGTERPGPLTKFFLFLYKVYLKWKKYWIYNQRTWFLTPGFIPLISTYVTWTSHWTSVSLSFLVCKMKRLVSCQLWPSGIH